MNMYLDDLEEEAFIAPIFVSLIKNKAPIDLIKNVFFDIGVSSYFKYLPDDLLKNSDFIKDCLDRNLINVENLPLEFANKTFISKEQYSTLISQNVNFLNLNLYPQDESIVFNMLKVKNNEHAYFKIDEKFKTNSNFMIKCLIENNELFRFLNPDIQENFLSNKKLTIQILKTNPTLIGWVDNNKRNDVDLIKAVLNTLEGYESIKESLNKIKDPEVALLALEKTDSARKFIHPQYSSILKQNKVNQNCYQFLKIYFNEKKLQNELTTNNQNNTHKIKI